MIARNKDQYWEQENKWLLKIKIDAENIQIDDWLMSSHEVSSWKEIL